MPQHFSLARGLHKQGEGEWFMLGKYWENYTHDADVGVRGIGATMEEAFEQVALAMTAAITDPLNVDHLEELDLACAAPDDELLLAEWLNAIVHQMATRHMLFSRFAVTINEHHLQAHLWGEEIKPSKHAPAVEVKGVTYTDLRVLQDETGTWLAQCVVDVGRSSGYGHSSI